MRKKISVAVVASLLISLSIAQPASATEPELANPSFFDVPSLVKALQNDVYQFKCSTNWDEKSKKTEIQTRCTKKNAEVYIHANAKPLGKDQYEGGFLTYFSYTVKSADLYRNLEIGGAQMCAGKVGEINAASIEAVVKWFKANYPNVKNKQILKKDFNGYNMSIIGGAGATRTVTCGSKPK